MAASCRACGVSARDAICVSCESFEDDFERPTCELRGDLGRTRIALRPTPRVQVMGGSQCERNEDGYAFASHPEKAQQPLDKPSSLYVRTLRLYWVDSNNSSSRLDSPC